MPAKVVADDREIVLAAEVDVFVGQLVFEIVVSGLEGFPLHRIFRGRAVKLARDQRGRLRVGTAELAGIQGDAHEEGVFEGALERG